MRVVLSSCIVLVRLSQDSLLPWDAGLQKSPQKRDTRIPV